MSKIPKPHMIAITGISGSGKTTVARRMAKQLDATLFEQDTTLIERDKRTSPAFSDKFDFAEANQLLTALFAFQPVSYVGYSQVTGKRDRLITLPIHNVIIVEGVLALKIPVVCQYASIIFWVEAPLEVAEARQWARWKNERWFPGLSGEEVMRRILIKRAEELPLIIEQRRLCTWIIDNSAALQPTITLIG